jgi:hypothetical protein
MTSKAAAHPLTKLEATWLEAIESCLTEMSLIRKRMKATDQRIQRADHSIRRSLDQTRAILRHVQGSLGDHSG